jgi:hypothetical protein
MKYNKKVVMLLTIAIIIMVAAIAITAIINDDGGSPYLTASLRDETIEIYGGDGLYRYNSTTIALMMKAFDWCYLLIGLPLMIIGLILYLRKSMIGYLLLVSTYFFFFYNFLITSVGTAYNYLFLGYMAVYVMCMFAMIIMIKGTSPEHIGSIMSKLPRKTLAIFVLVLASYFTINWLIIDISSLLAGSIHPDLDIYTTATFNVTDLSIYVPLSISAAVLFLRKKPLGAILSIMLILGAFQTMCSISTYTFMNVCFYQKSIMEAEFMMVIIALVCLGFSILALKNLKACNWEC